MSAVRLVCILYKWDYKMLLVVINLYDNPSIKSFYLFFYFHKLFMGEMFWGLKEKKLVTQTMLERI